ncbi:MAG: hypothetical protein C0518_01640 [Opitutus sp.]|nr:hypothetical protein [Opitutus sp.]
MAFVCNMLSLSSPPEIAQSLASRLKQRRLRRGWSQAELAERAGLKVPTYVYFERTGRISLERLIKVFEVLGLVAEIERLVTGEDLAGLSLAQLVEPTRQRGRRQRRSA